MENHIPKTYEELKKWLTEDCNIKIEDHPKQLLSLMGFPYWKCTNWEEISEAMSQCSVPMIGSAIYGFEGLEMVEIYDNWIHNNQEYRWDLLEGHDSSTSTVKKQGDE